MATQTRLSKKFKPATGKQVRQILDLIMDQNPGVGQAQAIISSGILSDLAQADLDKFDRDTFCLVHGVKPYRIEEWGKISIPSGPFELQKFESHLSKKRKPCELYVLDWDRSKLQAAASRDNLNGQTVRFSVVELNRFIGQEVLLKIFERDGYTLASLGELLWFIECNCTSLENSFFDSLCANSLVDGCTLNLCCAGVSQGICSLLLNSYSPNLFKIGTTCLLVKSI